MFKTKYSIVMKKLNEIITICWKQLQECGAAAAYAIHR